MAGKKGKAKAKAATTNAAVPNVYQEMLAEALPLQSEVPERPLKRRRTGRSDFEDPDKVPEFLEPMNNDAEDDADLDFEDIIGRDPRASTDIEESPLSPKALQFAYRDCDEDSGDSDYDWEGVDLDAKYEADAPTEDLELTLATISTRPSKAATTRRAATNADRIIRLEIHKMHVLCLLSFLNRRNSWCSDDEVQTSLKPLLTKKMLKFLRPKPELTQFGRTESLKRGLEDVSIMWRTVFSITERGMRRALWADDMKQLQNFRLSDDTESVFDRADFQQAAKKLKGSRDVGAQLFCALLRSAGVEARLVCSLQPLSFNIGGPSMLLPTETATKATSLKGDHKKTPVFMGGRSSIASGNTESTAPELHLDPRCRLGHPNAADYNFPEISTPPCLPLKPKQKAIHESAHPIFWVEAFDEAHQKWIPVDPLVTETIAKPRVLEPPASDRENIMTYVVAFEEDGYARDVTRRYAKAFNAKTRRNRVESTKSGERWWRKSLRAYTRSWVRDADQIEDAEFAAAEAREPMPKNVADFKNHPYYALERHLKKNEVLVGTRHCGYVATGRDTSVPGGKRLESVFRRRDVKIARSADAWYRLGREVKMSEQPIKTTEPKKMTDADDIDKVSERAGTNLYTEEQTELYEAPPVVNGRVPKNSYGNLDVFVPSMVPNGAVHLPYAEASRAARLLNIDFADALTGFEFRGRRGTAILKGIVIPTEYREAIEAVIECLRDEQAQVEANTRSLALLKMWKRFMIALRIKERIDGYQIEDEKTGEPNPHEYEKETKNDENFDDIGGGFFPE